MASQAKPIGSKSSPIAVNILRSKKVSVVPEARQLACGEFGGLLRCGDLVPSTSAREVANPLRHGERQNPRLPAATKKGL
jgi:hypothetical protein